MHNGNLKMNPSPAKPRILVLAQLPPPVHGAAIMNKAVVDSVVLGKLFAIDSLPVQLAGGIGDIGYWRWRKVTRLGRIIFAMVARLSFRRPAAIYLTLAPVGYAFFGHCLFIALAKAFGVPRLYHLHGKGVRAAVTRRPWLSGLYAWAFAGARVIHLSPRLYDDIAQYVPPAQFRFLPNGIPAPVMVEPALKAEGAPVNLLFLSNIIISKGPLVLLDALQLLAQRNVAFKAIFAGAPSEEMGVERFHAEVAARGLSGQVRYAGPLFGEAKARALTEADIFAFPTFYPQECFPLVLLEAMSYGLPIVTTPEGAIEDMVSHGVNGFLTAQGNAPALAEALERLALDGDLRRRFGCAGRSRYRENFQLPRHEEGMAAIWREFLDHP